MRSYLNEPGSLRKNVILVRNKEYLYKAMDWSIDPEFDYCEADEFKNFEDVNGRVTKDMQVILGACANLKQREGTILEIGTGYGRMTKYMSLNAPKASIYTINIPPELIDDGGEMTTWTLKKEEIGREYKEALCPNIQQIYENTLTWEPQMDHIDLAFIDGCHDEKFVYQDTLKVLSKCKKGSIIMWHDFNPELINTYDWVKGVCEAVSSLYRHGHLTNKTLYLQDSYVGLYIV